MVYIHSSGVVKEGVRNEKLGLGLPSKNDTVDQMGQDPTDVNDRIRALRL